MTKLEELKAAHVAAAACAAADATADDARGAYYTAHAAYRAELKKTQEENAND